MPTYQYACTECDHSFEQAQKFSDPSLTVCPQCQGRLRKIFNAVGVVFKGSGFYRTDSRSDAKHAASLAAGNGSGSAKQGETTPAAKTEGTKTETKSESTKSESTTAKSKTESTSAA